MNCPFCNKILKNESKSKIVTRFHCHEQDHLFQHGLVEFTLAILKENVRWHSWCDPRGSGGYLSQLMPPFDNNDRFTVGKTIYEEDRFREADAALLPFIYKLINIKAFL
jgi:hypothetical protein